MAFPNVSDILATTIENRTKTVQDNVTKNNAFLSWMKKGGNIKTFAGGHKIYEEISFAENGNFGWYSGYDPLPVAAQDVISAAEFAIKQCAVPVTISGLEELMNASKEKMIDLMDSRLAVAEGTMANKVAQALYSDGTGFGGKQLTGLDAAVPVDPTIGTYGGISRVSYTMWRSQLEDPGSAYTAANIGLGLNTLWSKCVRGSDRPDLILMDSLTWNMYVASLQALQRFAGTDSAGLGFPTIKFMDADVVLDGGIGGFASASTAYFLNTKFFKFRPHAQRNFVPLSPNKRYAINQDAEVQILAFAGNITSSGPQFCGRLVNT